MMNARPDGPAALDEEKPDMPTKTLASLDLNRLSAIAMTVHGAKRRPKFSTKKAALRSIEEGRVTKQAVVLGLLQDGVTVTEIEETLGINRAYARDIIAKLQLKGYAIEKKGDVFRLRAKRRGAH